MARGAVHGRMFSSIAGPYTLDASSTPHPTPCGENQKYLPTLPDVPWGENHLWLRTTDLVQPPGSSTDVETVAQGH